GENEPGRKASDASALHQRDGFPSIEARGQKPGACADRAREEVWHRGLQLLLGVELDKLRQDSARDRADACPKQSAPERLLTADRLFRIAEERRKPRALPKAEPGCDAHQRAIICAVGRELREREAE